MSGRKFQHHGKLTFDFLPLELYFFGKLTSQLVMMKHESPKAFLHEGFL